MAEHLVHDSQSPISTTVNSLSNPYPDADAALSVIPRDVQTADTPQTVPPA